MDDEILRSRFWAPHMIGYSVFARIVDGKIVLNEESGCCEKCEIWLEIDALENLKAFVADYQGQVGRQPLADDRDTVGRQPFADTRAKEQ